ncbi:hypothetical protein RICGR_0432 [Rickettsiella grylli]|uniref:Uncharacterized protein n=1 Tax=Rickettsiella grylli TaxID=59196 RepID=A8PLH8_9COXI|nr:hypothetical protein RICGR_0432 [Rickettsiella grylli]
MKLKIDYTIHVSGSANRFPIDTFISRDNLIYLPCARLPSREQEA